MPGVTGHKVIGFGCLGAFEKTVVGFVGGDGKRLRWRYEVRNFADRGEGRLNVPRLQF